jgi:hypothetical protein
MFRFGGFFCTLVALWCVVYVGKALFSCVHAYIVKVQGFRLMQDCSNSCLLFLFNNRYLFRSYGHLQVEIYTWKLTRLLCDVGMFFENDDRNM